MRLFLHPLLPAGLAVAFLAGCSSQNEFAPPPPPEVMTSHPRVETITAFDEFSGRIEGVDRVEITARIPGFLEEIHFEEGVRINEGDLLFSIEKDAYIAAVESAIAALQRAEASAGLAKTRERQQKQLFEKGAISEIDYLTAAAELAVSDASVAEAQAAVRKAELDLSYTEVHSPMSGRISQRYISIGNLVGTATSSLLATVVNDDPINVFFSIPEREVLRYLRQYPRDERRESRRALALRLTFADGSVFENTGTVDYVANEMSPGTATIEVRAVFPNPKSFATAGMFARVGIPVELENAVLIPSRLIQRDQVGDFVYVVGPENKVGQAYITRVRNLGESYVVDGLESDAALISEGLQRVRPGMTVKPIAAPAPPTTPEPTQAEAPVNSGEVSTSGDDSQD